MQEEYTDNVVKTKKAKNPIDVEFFFCSEAITYKYGLVAAALYGVIWSYNQLPSGFCLASEATLGKKIGGYSDDTVRKYLYILRESCLIKFEERKRYKNGGVTLRIKCNHNFAIDLDTWYREEKARLKKEDEYI